MYKASEGTREHYVSVHSDQDPLDIPPFDKWSGIHIWSDTTIVSIGVAGCQFGSEGVTIQVSLGEKVKQFWF